MAKKGKNKSYTPVSAPRKTELELLLEDAYWYHYCQDYRAAFWIMQKIIDRVVIEEIQVG